MTRADEFAKDMCGELEKHTRKNGITWTVGKREKGCHEVVDVQGRLKGDSLNARPRFLVEVELRRGQPLGNVIKIWKWFQRGPKGHTVIQAFSRFYRRNGQKGTRQLNAEFAGKQMQKARIAKYISIDFDYSPRKNGRIGGGRRRSRAVALSLTILQRLVAEMRKPRRAILLATKP